MCPPSFLKNLFEIFFKIFRYSKIKLERVEISEKKTRKRKAASLSLVVIIIGNNRKLCRCLEIVGPALEQGVDDIVLNLLAAQDRF